MSDVYAALRRTVSRLGVVGATNNARREQREHARVAAEVDALAHRLAQHGLAPRAVMPPVIPAVMPPAMPAAMQPAGRAA